MSNSHTGELGYIFDYTAVAGSGRHEIRLTQSSWAVGTAAQASKIPDVSWPGSDHAIDGGCRYPIRPELAASDPCGTWNRVGGRHEQRTGSDHSERRRQDRSHQRSVFDGRRLREPGAVVIDGDAIGKDPAGARVIDCDGAVLLPGLIDAHVHLYGREDLEQLTGFGVTTALDIGTPWAVVNELRGLKGLTDIRSGGKPAAPGQCPRSDASPESQVAGPHQAPISLATGSPKERTTSRSSPIGTGLISRR